MTQIAKLGVTPDNRYITLGFKDHDGAPASIAMDFGTALDLATRLVYIVMKLDPDPALRGRFIEGVLNPPDMKQLFS